MDLQLIDSAKYKTLAILFDVDVQRCLNHVRNLIDEQVSDLLPSDMYFFYHNGMKISKDISGIAQGVSSILEKKNKGTRQKQLSVKSQSL